MGSDGVTCHPTQVNVHRLTQAVQAGAGRYLIYIARTPQGWKAELT